MQWCLFLKVGPNIEHIKLNDINYDHIKLNDINYDHIKLNDINYDFFLCKFKFFLYNEKEEFKFLVMYNCQFILMKI